MTLRKLIAFDAADLAVLSAHLQDAEMSAQDMAYLPRERRFALVGTRYTREDGMGVSKRAVGVHFEQVTHVKSVKITPGTDEALQLLALHYSEKDAPAGRVHLLFAGGGEISLDVDCLEAALSDLDAGDPCQCPEHQL